MDLAAFRAAKAEAAPYREALALVDATEEDFSDAPAEFRFWMDAFKFLMGFAYGLLDSRHLRKLAERIEDTEQRYMPGGPPMSPLTDSFHSFWSVADLSVGLKKESLASISIAVARSLGMPREPLAAWQVLADSYAGVYRIARGAGEVTTLVELVTGEEREVVLADSIPGKLGQVWWVRLLPPQRAEHRYWTTITTPYLFEHPNAAELWLGYFDRQLGEMPPNKRASSYRRLMKQGPSPDAWFEFILDAYVGEREHALALMGVPDLPESLPHSDEDDDADASPLHRLRLQLWRVASGMGLHDVAMDDFLDARAELTGLADSPLEEWNDPERILFYAYLAWECRDERGLRAVDELDREKLDPEELEQLQALENGWFSIFEVLSVKVDEAIEVRDVVRRRRFWITERSATRSLLAGDCIGCWIMKSGEQTFMEGAVAHVPRMWSAMVIDTIREIVASMRKRAPSMPWRERQGLLVPWVSAMMASMMNKRPPVQLVNHDGDDFVMARAHYSISDRGLMLDLLRAKDELEETSPGTFVWTSEKDILAGEIALSGNELCISANSKERLAKLRAWLEVAAGDGVHYEATSFEDPLSTKHESSGMESSIAIEDLPDEALEQMAAMLRERLVALLDTRVPMLGNNTPRQAVRSAKGRDDTTSWLLGQERIIKADPFMRALMDTSFMWRELGLSHPDGEAES